MPVYDRSYRRWDGHLKRHPLRFMPIAGTGIRTALGSKWGWFFTATFRFLLVVSLVPFLLLFFANYALAYRPGFLDAADPGFLRFLDTLEPYRVVQYPLLLRFNTPFLMLFTVLFGSGLIARDRAAGALPLYLSRPLTLTDYVLGKFCVIGWFLASLTLFPCLILWLFGVLSSPDPHAFRNAVPALLPIFGHSATVVIVYGSTILGVSALCRRPMFAALIWFGTVILVPVFTGAFGYRFGWQAAAAVSPNNAFQSIGFQLYDIAGLAERARATAGNEYQDVEGFFQMLNIFDETPVEWCWLSAAAWSALGLLILIVSLKRQEVVGDAAR